MTKKELEVLDILESVIEDFNTIWDSHTAQNAGMQEYAEQIVKLFAIPAVSVAERKVCPDCGNDNLTYHCNNPKCDNEWND